MRSAAMGSDVAMELTVVKPSGDLWPEVVIRGMEVGVTLSREGVDSPMVLEDAAAARFRWR